MSRPRVHPTGLGPAPGQAESEPGRAAAARAAVPGAAGRAELRLARRWYAASPTAIIPNEVAKYWPRGGAVFVAVRILPNGRATDCKINRSIGVPAIDQWTCKLVEERAIFRPATDPSGRPVAAWFGYVQQESRRR